MSGSSPFLLTSQVQMTASEATAHDPQLRMLLEVTFECLDNGTFFPCRIVSWILLRDPQRESQWAA